MYNTPVVTDETNLLNIDSCTTVLPLRLGVEFLGFNMSVEIECKVCGKFSHCPPRRVNTMKYCSRKCTGKGKAKARCQIFNGHSYYEDIHGYFIKRVNGRTRIHRDKWEHYNEPIPEGYFVHHINHKKDDNRISNLTIMEKGVHSALHNTPKVERKCTSDGCDRRHAARGYCQKHYQYLQYNGELS